MNNFKKFIISNSIFDFALGFFGPFWFLFISDFGGGIEQFGYAIALMMLGGAFTSFYVGRLSDSIGRKRMLIGSGIGLAILVFVYTIITNTTQLYILQILYGIVMAIQGTNEAAIIGDLTESQGRGADVGRLHFFAQIAAAIAIVLAGIIGARYGTNIIFYITSILMLLSTLALSRIQIK